MCGAGDTVLAAVRSLQVRFGFRVKTSIKCGDFADANFSILRRTALSLLKNNQSKKVGVKNKRLAAALDEDYLMEVLLGK